MSGAGSMDDLHLTLHSLQSHSYSVHDVLRLTTGPAAAAVQGAAQVCHALRPTHPCVIN